MSSNLSDTIAQRLEYLINLADLSKKDFAASIGKDRRTIHSWLSGQVPFRKNMSDFIIDAFKTKGVLCTKEWLEDGEGDFPTKISIDSPILFEHFNLDFALNTIVAFHKQMYPNLIHLFVNDAIYFPRLTPQTLLISNPMPQEKYKPNWPHGYLFKNEDEQIMPVDMVKKEERLIVMPFEQKGYISKEYILSAEDCIYPIILNRPVY